MRTDGKRRILVSIEENTNRRWWSELSDAEKQRVIDIRRKKLKKWWQDMSGVDREEHLEQLRQAGLLGTAAARLAKPTMIERIVASLLDALRVSYLQEHRIGRYIVDFFVPAKRLIIECDGEYWHGKPEVKARDAVRDRILREQGYTIVRLAESDIRAGRALERLRSVS